MKVEDWRCHLASETTFCTKKKKKKKKNKKKMKLELGYDMLPVSVYKTRSLA